MRARLPMMIQDPEISQTDVGRMVEDWIGLDQEHYLDGPVTPRIAVVDLDPDTEALRPAVKFQPPSGSRTLGRYAANRNAVESRAVHRRQRLRHGLADGEAVRGGADARPHDQLGVRGPAAPRRPAGGLAGERLLRAQLAQPPASPPAGPRGAAAPRTPS